MSAYCVAFAYRPVSEVGKWHLYLKMLTDLRLLKIWCPSNYYVNVEKLEVWNHVQSHHAGISILSLIISSSLSSICLNIVWKGLSAKDIVNDQFWNYIKIWPNTTDLSTRLCGILKPHKLCSLSQTPCTEVYCLIYQNWSIALVH